MAFPVAYSIKHISIFYIIHDYPICTTAKPCMNTQNFHCYRTAGTPSFWALLGASFSISSSSRICIICIWAASREIREPVCFHQGISWNFQNVKTNKHRKEFSAIGYRSKNRWEEMSFYWICNSFGNSFQFHISCIMHHEIARRKSKNSWPPGVPMKKLAETCFSDWDCTVFYRGFQPTFSNWSWKDYLHRCPWSLLWGIDVSRCFRWFLMLCAVSCNGGDTFDDHPRCIILTIRLKQCQTMDLDRLRRIIYSCF